jgi:hypothetical protein
MRVLMDLQMPVMDGLTATRLIRDRLALTHLPIIVLTAGVLPEQRQAAHQAGADAVMTKPVDLDQIAGLLRPWVPTQESASPRTPTPEPAAPTLPGPSGEALPAIAGINRIKAAKVFHGNPELLRKLLATFARDYARVVEATRGDLDRGERASAARRSAPGPGCRGKYLCHGADAAGGHAGGCPPPGRGPYRGGAPGPGPPDRCPDHAASAPWRAVTTAEGDGPAQPHPPASIV